MSDILGLASQSAMFLFCRQLRPGTSLLFLFQISGPWSICTRGPRALPIPPGPGFL